MIGDFEIPGSPFGCEVYDISQVRVGKMPKGLVGKPYEFDSKYKIISGAKVFILTILPYCAEGEVVIRQLNSCLKA